MCPWTEGQPAWLELTEGVRWVMKGLTTAEEQGHFPPHSHMAKGHNSVIYSLIYLINVS